MINTSTEFKQNIRENRDLHVKLISVQDGRADITLYETNLRAFSYEGHTSNTNSFDIGACITGQVDFTVDNMDGNYTEEDFYSSEVYAYVGQTVSTGIEYLYINKYYVVDAQTTGQLISIRGYDAMNKFTRDYSESTLTYPATLYEIVIDCCLKCGVTLHTTNFDYKDYIVSERFEDDATFKDVLSYVGQISGHYVVIKEDKLCFEWYGSPPNILDGNATGDIIDGNALPSDNIIDGNIPDDTTQNDYFHIYALSKTPTIQYRDIVITGIKVKAMGDSSDYGETYLYGTDDYALEIENPLILPGQAQTIATHLGDKIIGTTFRALSCSALSDPSIQHGDVGFVSTHKGVYGIILTNHYFSFNEYSTYRCSGKAAEINSSQNFSEATKLLSRANIDTSRQLSYYDQSVKMLTQLMTYSFGVHKTEETDETGATIYYLHDKPLKSESTKIWKMTSDAFSVSNDGGVTYSAGLDVDGNFTAATISTGLLVANYIKTGKLEGVEIDIGSGTFIVQQDGNLNLTTTFQKVYGPYTNADYDRVSGITTFAIVPTDEDFDKFDINNDGKIDTRDRAQVARRMSDIWDGIVNFTIDINTEDRKPIELHSQASSSSTIYSTRLGCGHTETFSSIADEGVFGTLRIGANDALSGIYPFFVSGNAYIVGNVSADSFTDRTPFYDGNALEELSKISGIDGEIDHDTLPEFAQVKKLKVVEKETFEDYSNIEIIEETERDLGNMISILTKGIQEQIEVNTKQQQEIEFLKAEIQALKDKI